MLTFNQIYSEVQSQTQDTDTTSTLPMIKRAINQGMRKFGAILNRDWRVVYRTFPTAASQRYYQMPEDAIRIKSLTVTVGSITYPLTEIVDEERWQDLTRRTTPTSTVPEYYFVLGSDQFGIWPTPSAINTATIGFEANMRDMTADDYTTGTLAMTAASPAVVGTGTAFTSAMVGRVLFVDPTGGTGDGSGYKIYSVTDTTHLTLENNYSGATASGKSFAIGEVPDIPDEFHEALVDYAAYRYYRRRRDLQTAKDLKAAFDEAIILCQENYSSKSSSQYFRAPRQRNRYGNVDRRVT